MFVHVEHENGDAAPDAALVVGIGLVDAEFFCLHIPGEDRPAACGHAASGEIRDKVFPCAMLGDDSVLEGAFNWLAIPVERVEVVFVEVDAVYRERFSVFESAEFRIALVRR